MITDHRIKFSKQTNKNLKNALRLLHKTHELGENSIENLLEQSEILENTKKNMNIIDDRMDVADNIIQKMNSLFKIPKQRKKNVLKFENENENENENESVPKNIVEGYVLKRTRHLGIWVKRYFKFNLDTKIIEYFLHSNTKLLGYIDLNDSEILELDYNSKDHNGFICKKINCLEIAQFDGKTSRYDTIHFISHDSYTKWLEYFRGKQLPKPKDKSILSEIHEMLDKVENQSNKISEIVDQQNKNLTLMNKYSTKLSTRIDDAKHKVQCIK
jgi:hypothetical protein